MASKKLIQNFYKSDALIDPEVMKDFLHPEIILDWNSSKGFVQMNFDSIVNLAAELSKAYVRSKVRISHILAENDLVSVRYSHYVKTVENPREEMFLANFIVIWQLKDDKLYRGYQMSQIS
jgi:predicted SnoaL-like aldol condensation-catalyzing enzyme